MANVFLACLVAFFCSVISYGEVVEDKSQATTFMAKYGYFASTGTEYAVGDDVSESTMTKTLKAFQDFTGLNQTGKLDGPTMAQMQIDRCGHKDVLTKPKGRNKRFLLQGSKWHKRDLTWRYDPKLETKDLSRADVLDVMRQAFKLWSVHTNIRFHESNTATKPDIWVKFSSRAHGDAYPFDGVGGTLAHAFYPIDSQRNSIAGDVHFDDAETYTKESASGRNLLWVATHELGHALGIEHSRERSAVMFPYYTKYKPGFKLNYDDIVAVQSLYGGVERQQPGDKATTEKPEEQCKDLRGKRSCDSWTKSGYCTDDNYRNYMTTNCCATCKAALSRPTTTTTTVTTKKPCKDTSKLCPSYADAGYCSRADYRVHLSNICCKSCTGAGGKTPEPTPGPDPEPEPTTTTTTSTTTTKRPDTFSCPATKITAIWDVGHVPKYKGSFAMATENHKVYIVNEMGEIQHAYVDISKYVKQYGYQLENPIDAGVTTSLGYRNSKKYQILFSGENYMLYDNFFERISGPHNLHDVDGPLNIALPSYVEKITAAMKYQTKRNKVYLFFTYSETGYYFRYDTRYKRIDRGYPKLVGVGFLDLPSTGVDAAMSSKRTKKTYFIADNDLYRLNQRDAKVMPGYPDVLGNEIIKCVRPGALKADKSTSDVITYLRRIFYGIKLKLRSGAIKVDDSRRSVELDN